jgi:DNA-directed RNA polymerase specialized sigma24 family protein
MVNPLDLFFEHEHMAQDVVHQFYWQFPLDMHDDVRSEARLALWRAATTYNGRGTFAGYAWMCVMRKVMSMLKVWRRYWARDIDSLDRIVLSAHSGDGRPIADMLGREDFALWQEQEAAAEIMDVVIKTGEPALVLRCTEHLSDTDIGRRLGLDQETITRRIRIARRKAIPMLKWRGVIA